MSEYHQTHHIRIVEQVLEGLDAEEIAIEANAITGGSMRGEDALKLVKMVSLAAFHKPETDVIVAGIGARVTGAELHLFCYGPLGKEVDRVALPN